MTIVNHSSYGVESLEANSPLKLRILPAPVPLFRQGIILQIVVSAPRSSVEDGDHVRSIMVNALLDTGATNTSIDETIAKKLMLSPIGFSEIGTAGGKRTSATYVADISFPGLGLLPQRMLRIGSCNLSFNEKIGTSRPQNLGALIGRDILSKWLVVWNGPGATVSICD